MTGPGGLVVGVGAGRGVPAEEILTLIADTLRAAGLDPGQLVALATVEAKAAEPGVRAAADRLGIPLITYSAQNLSTIPVPHPSGRVEAAAGTPAVAEAAALAGAEGGQLLVSKRKSAPSGRAAKATVAVARRG